MLSCMSSLDILDINSLSDTSFGNVFLRSVRQPFFVAVLNFLLASLVAQLVENPPAMRETWV